MRSDRTSESSDKCADTNLSSMGARHSTWLYKEHCVNMLNVNRWFPDHNSENRLPIPFMSKWSFVGLCLGYIDKTCPPFSDQSNCTLTSSDGYIYLSGARFESILQFLNLKTICFHSMTLISKYRLSATTSLQLLVVLGPQNKFYKNVYVWFSSAHVCPQYTFHFKWVSRLLCLSIGLIELCPFSQ